MNFKKRAGKIAHGISAKTTLSHVTLAVLVILFTSISMYWLSFSYLRGYLKEHLLSDAIKVAALESGAPNAEFNARRVKIYEELTDATVLYFDKDYVATHLNSENSAVSQSEPEQTDSDLRKTRILGAMDQYFFACILSGEPMADIRYFQFVNGDTIFAGAPVKNAIGMIVGGIVLIQPISKFRSQTSLMFTMLLCVTAISIPLAIFIALKLSRRLTKPLLEITSGARMLAEGHYGERIDLDQKDELGELAESLNTLSRRIRHAIGHLSEERDKLDLIMNGIGEGIIAVDWYMRVIHYNQSFLALTEMDECPSELPADGVYGAILKKAIKSGAREKTVWEDVSGRKLRAIASPLHSGAGVIIGAVCLVQDVSESERLEQMRRDYVANISHELRTPLTGIRGMVEPLMDGIFETEEEKQECYSVIYKETIRLEKLIREMLDMSRLQDGRLTIEMEMLEINGIVVSAARRVAKTAADAGIRLITDVPSDGIPCFGNEDRILQVLTVFLDNALSFTPSGGSVTISARNTESTVRMSVKDTGCGIEPKDLPYIWERFYKVDKSRMRTSGTGLGLAIAKLIVELMGGEIGVDTVPGKGSEFWFTLPAGKINQ